MREQIMLTIDINKCTECNSCSNACHKEYGLTGVHLRQGYKEKRSNFSFSCRHCGNPLCMIICPENNFRKRRDGIVVLDTNHCSACMRCVNVCPFHAPQLNPDTSRVDKCDLCVERIDQGLLPTCVINCPKGAVNIVRKKRKSSHDVIGIGTPIISYMNPSVYVVEKKVTDEFFMRGMNSI